MLATTGYPAECIRQVNCVYPLLNLRHLHRRLCIHNLGSPHTLPSYAGPASGQQSPASAANAAGGAHQTAGGNGAHAASTAGQPPGLPSHPATPEQWVDAFVAAMAEAQDVADARQRAARLLHAFQQAVIGATAGQVGTNCASALSLSRAM